MQQYYAQAGPATVNERIQRTEERVEAFVKQLAEEDLAAATRFVEELQERLETLLDELKPPAPRQADEGAAPSRRTYAASPLTKFLGTFKKGVILSNDALFYIPDQEPR